MSEVKLLKSANEYAQVLQVINAYNIIMANPGKFGLSGKIKFIEVIQENYAELGFANKPTTESLQNALKNLGELTGLEREQWVESVEKLKDKKTLQKSYAEYKKKVGSTIESETAAYGDAEQEFKLNRKLNRKAKNKRNWGIVGKVAVVAGCVAGAGTFLGGLLGLAGGLTGLATVASLPILTLGFIGGSMLFGPIKSLVKKMWEGLTKSINKAKEIINGDESVKGSNKARKKAKQLMKEHAKGLNRALVRENAYSPEYQREYAELESLASTFTEDELDVGGSKVVEKDPVIEDTLDVGGEEKDKVIKPVEVVDKDKVVVVPAAEEVDEEDKEKIKVVPATKEVSTIKKPKSGTPRARSSRIVPGITAKDEKLLAAEIVSETIDGITLKNKYTEEELKLIKSHSTQLFTQTSVQYTKVSRNDTKAPNPNKKVYVYKASGKTEKENKIIIINEDEVETYISKIKDETFKETFGLKDDTQIFLNGNEITIDGFSLDVIDFNMTDMYKAYQTAAKSKASEYVAKVQKRAAYQEVHNAVIDKRTREIVIKNTLDTVLVQKLTAKDKKNRQFYGKYELTEVEHKLRAELEAKVAKYLQSNGKFPADSFTIGTGKNAIVIEAKEVFDLFSELTGENRNLVAVWNIATPEEVQQAKEIASKLEQIDKLAKELGVDVKDITKFDSLDDLTPDYIESVEKKVAELDAQKKAKDAAEEAEKLRKQQEEADKQRLDKRKSLNSYNFDGLKNSYEQFGLLSDELGKRTSSKKAFYHNFEEEYQSSLMKLTGYDQVHAKYQQLIAENKAHPFAESDPKYAELEQCREEETKFNDLYFKLLRVIGGEEELTEEKLREIEDLVIAGQPINLEELAKMNGAYVDRINKAIEPLQQEKQSKADAKKQAEVEQQRKEAEARKRAEIIAMLTKGKPSKEDLDMIIQQLVADKQTSTVIKQQLELMGFTCGNHVTADVVTKNEYVKLVRQYLDAKAFKKSPYMDSIIEVNGKQIDIAQISKVVAQKHVEHQSEKGIGE